MPRGKINRRKRGDNEGTIYQRKMGKYLYWVYQMRYADGTQSKPVYCKTESEAVEGLRKLSYNLSMGYTPTDITFNDWASQWIETKQVSEKTMEIYARNVKAMNKYVGWMKLDKIQPSNLEVAYRGLEDSGLSKSSVNQIARTTSNVLRSAWKNGVITRDIGGLAVAPKSTNRSPVILSAEQRNILFQETELEVDGLLVEFLLKTGMRIQKEALATTWEQVDFDMEKGKATVTVGESKTEAGEGRVIPLEEGLASRLRTRFLKDQGKQLADKTWNKNNLVFCNSVGNNHNVENLRRGVWKRLKKVSDIDPRITFHDLRHNYGSYLLSEGVPIAMVSKLMGHSNVATTLNIYIHEMKEDMTKVREVMARMVTVS